ncbi:hypothetical protein CsSME_00030240 [Camellia sinensis var. sinensis]
MMLIHRHFSIPTLPSGMSWKQLFRVLMTGLWDQLALMEPPSLKILDAYIEFREQGRLIQFLTALFPQYEAIRGGIIH